MPECPFLPHRPRDILRLIATCSEFPLDLDLETRGLVGDFE